MCQMDRWMWSSVGPSVQYESACNLKNHQENNNVIYLSTSPEHGQWIGEGNGPCELRGSVSYSQCKLTNC